MSLSGKELLRSIANPGSEPSAEAPVSKPLAPTAHQTATYIADICTELVIIAKAADLIFLAHLLTLAQAEGESERDKNI
jgi:hypothetical protein